MEKKKILFVSQEITPYLPETEISHIGRYLPQGIQEKGKEIRSFMPRFGVINERRNQLHEVIRLSGMNLIIDDTDHSLIIKVASIQSARMQVYFIDNEDFFHRKATLLDDKSAPFADNDERAIFFARGVLETVMKLRWTPDIVHCHGWFTGLVPLYLKTAYKDEPTFADSKIVFSAYDDGFDQSMASNFAEKSLIDGVKASDVERLNDASYLGLNKLAVDYSDAVIQGNEGLRTDVKDYISESGKPFLDYQTKDTYIDAYNGLYDSLLG